MKIPIIFLSIFSSCILFSCSKNSSLAELDPNRTVNVMFEISLEQEIHPFPSTRNMPGDLPSEPASGNSSSEGDINNPGNDGEESNNSGNEGGNGSGSENDKQGNESNGGENIKTPINLSFLEYALFDKDGNLLNHSRENTNTSNDTKNNSSNRYSSSHQLKGGLYKVCFVAHSIKDATFLDNILTFPTVNDTFWGTIEIEVDATLTNQTFEISLDRVIAGIDFYSKDAIPKNIDKFTITTNIFNKINIFDGTIPKETIPFSLIANFTEIDKQKKEGINHLFYSFAPNTENKDIHYLIEQAELTSYTATETKQRYRKIENIPIYRNKITRYKGTLYTPSIVDGSFEITINSSWDGIIENEFQ